MNDQPLSRYDYDTAVIRDLLKKSFSDEDFSIFCFDKFSDVYTKFALGMSFTQKVQLLVEYCDQHSEFQKLLNLVKEENPTRYAEFSPRLFKTEPVPPRPSISRPESASSAPTKIFLSHAHQDSDMAHRLAEDLRRAGLAVWWDVSDLRGGDSWSRTIENALRASQVCLVLLSPDSVKSQWVEREYLYAEDLGLKIIPLLYQDSVDPIFWLRER